MASSVLPPTCGEETNVPGVPSIGCVSVIDFTLGGFSATVSASCDAVYVLGPNLDAFPERALLHSRLLWRPPVVHGAAAEAREGMVEADNPLHRVQSSHGSTRAAESTGDVSGTRITNLVAFLLRPASPAAHQDKMASTHVDDAIGVCVAWAEPHGDHHISFLQVSLKKALRPSVRSADLGLSSVLDVSPRTKHVGVLRLFYHADFAHQAAESGAPSSRHVVLCSCYESSSSSHEQTETDLEKFASLSLSGVPTKAAAASRQTERRVDASRRQHSQHKGKLMFLSVNAASRSAPADCIPAEESDVAPWLRSFQPRRVITAFSIQTPHGSVIAAAGSKDGRVFLLGEKGHTVIHRCSGPVADMCFVRTAPSSGDAAARCSAVDRLVEAAGSSHRSPAAADAALDDGDSSLVALDSVGSMIVIRAINSEAPVPQVVPDIQQMITLVNQQRSTVMLVNANGESDAMAQPTVSSKHFFDLSSLRHFFHKKGKAPLLPVMAGSSPSAPSPSPLLSSAAVTPVNRSFAHAPEDMSRLSGHVLSRGLICVANMEGARGRPELVVSTLGQVVVSIPFDPAEGGFSISGFTVTPTPMHYVGFVDFFGTGCADLVLGSYHSILVSRRSPNVVRERALLLMRLLSHHTARRSLGETTDLLET